MSWGISPSRTVTDDDDRNSVRCPQNIWIMLVWWAPLPKSYAFWWSVYFAPVNVRRALWWFWLKALAQHNWAYRFFFLMLERSSSKLVQQSGAVPKTVPQWTMINGYWLNYWPGSSSNAAYICRYATLISLYVWTPNDYVFFFYFLIHFSCDAFWYLVTTVV